MSAVVYLREAAEAAHAAWSRDLYVTVLCAPMGVEVRGVGIDRVNRQEVQASYLASWSDLDSCRVNPVTPFIERAVREIRAKLPVPNEPKS